MDGSKITLKCISSKLRLRDYICSVHCTFILVLVLTFSVFLDVELLHSQSTLGTSLCATVDLKYHSLSQLRGRTPYGSFKMSAALASLELDALYGFILALLVSCHSSNVMQISKFVTLNIF